MRRLEKDDGFAETRLLIANDLLQRGDDLDRAVTLLDEAVTMDFAYRSSALTLLGRALELSRNGTGDAELLRRLVDVDRQLAELPESGRTELMNLSIDLLGWFHAGGGPGLLDEAVTALRQALTAPPVDDPSEAMCWFELLVVLRTRFERAGDPDDLEQAIAAGRSAVAAAAPADPDWSKYHSGLAGLLALTGDAGHVPETTDRLREAVRHTSPADPGWSVRRGRLAGLLEEEYNRTGRPELLDELIEVLAEPGAPEDAAFLAGLGAARWERFEQAGDEADLDAAVAAARRSLALSPPAEADAGEMRWSASRVLSAADQRRQDPGLLGDAIAAGRAAVAVMDADSDDLGPRLITLGALLTRRFDRDADPADLDEAIVHEERAVSAPGSPVNRRLILALDLRQRFARAGDTADLERAVALMAEVMEHRGRDDELGQAESALLAESMSTLRDHLNNLTGRDLAVRAARRDLEHAEESRRVIASGRLGEALWLRFELTGDVADLEESIRHTRVAAGLAEESSRASLLADVGRRLRMWFESTGDLAVLREAIDTMRQVVNEAAPDDPEIGGYLGAAGLAFEMYGERAGLPHLLEMATGYFRDAVAITPEDGDAYLLRAGNLARHLSAEAARTGDPALAGEAVEQLREVVGRTGAGDPRRPLYQLNLGQALRTRFRLGLDPDDLDAAAGVTRDALAALPDGHPAQPKARINLGHILRARFELTGDAADRDGAIAAYREATSAAGSDPELRVRAARDGALAAAEAGQYTEALAGFTVAVETLPSISPRNLGRDDQEHRLQGFSGLAAVAGSAALDAGDPDRAVLLIEQARGILLAQEMETRGETAGLAEHYPAIAAEFESARRELNRSPEEDGTGTAHQASADRRRRALAWSDLLDRIRALPSFDRFLLPPTLPELIGEAAEGPIVLLSTGPDRSDALAVTSGGVRHVPLPGLGAGVVRDRVRDFLVLLETLDRRDLPFAQRYAAIQAMNGFLGWLWDAAAGPVLDALGCDGDPVRRVWWAPAGRLAFLPWHAAGHHDRRDERPAPACLDRVVSSYTPTLRTLVHLRARSLRSAPAGSLLIGMAETPDAGSLPGVPGEIADLTALLPDAVVLCDRDATRDRVLDHLTRASLVHFACHGVSVPDRPSASRLLVHDHADRPLTVLDIARLHLDRARLVYLSACSTGQASARLTDEAIHITSAFQLAGFPHVIGTMWTVDDLAAADLARGFYARLPDGPAVALHSAVRAARDQAPDRPDLWAAHLHAGV
ncbi:CHAT domain-containing protein [Actinoplanes bogorensis]|uniref:CHAT domain-containing protein n=1 Tax=Paractinoplanes bogorensis TaxID=1610840 RepID=A0ABS5YU00_9ACTN|nr:CHAT domain-containing protein [Actinoplanes bogorensis]MBU2666937.1 CHAT domain-containing protein [Actinoplanes bogorensis]